MAGTFDWWNLVDAKMAVWVLGGSKQCGREDSHP